MKEPQVLWQAIGLAMIAIAAAAMADEAPIAVRAKSQYSLFHPTPRQFMRPLSADRPDVTESPYTVDSGHYQLELSFVQYAWDDDGPSRTRRLEIAPANLKLGLLNNLDVQLVFAPFVDQEESSSGSTAREQGLGDTQLRLKLNIWGNDQGPSAFALLPFVQLPTGDGELSSDHVEGGILFPLALTLPAEFDLGLMGGIEMARNAANDGYRSDFIHTATVDHDLAGPLGGYVEYVGVAPTEGRYAASLGMGLVYLIGENLQLDAGVNLGLNDSAEDYSVFSGITARR